MHAILTFHSIDEKDSVISYSPVFFAQLLQELANRDIPVLDLDTLLQPGTNRGVAITFDDGMQSVHRNAMPVLQEHGMPAHLFLATGAAGDNRPWPRDPCDGHTFTMLDWGEIEALHSAGIRIESHTHNHPDMRTLTAERMQEECEQADSIIESRLGRRPQYFAYPFGYHDRKVRDFARERYRGTVTTELRSLPGEPDYAALPRLDSYYLRSPLMIRNIGSASMRGYLAARNVLRNLKGSQCRADCD
ncbi:MAG: polysaccharide deacetylase family protein [Gammaproteobacteria bacterium]|nr:polysaccharide deacetylase family protein [Gammaproteobacteria bacterium]